jgi:hypothetical protein
MTIEPVRLPWRLRSAPLREGRPSRYAASAEDGSTAIAYRTCRQAATRIATRWRTTLRAWHAGFAQLISDDPQG